jgi:NAD(P)-dependent dehydrogenase (short-subunit alcohol dehydrogenase family)
MCRISRLADNRWVLISEYAAGAAGLILAGIAAYRAGKRGVSGPTRTAADQHARDRARRNVVHAGLTDTATVRSADEDGLLPAPGGFANSGAANLVDIAGCVAFSGLPQRRGPHMGSHETPTRWVDVIAKLYPRTVT